MTKRCFSLCRKQEKKDCNKTRRCKYNEGSKRDFCRLNMSKYKLNKNCVVKPKVTKKNRFQEAAKIIQKNVRIIQNRKKKQTKKKVVKEKKTKKKLIKKIIKLPTPKEPTPRIPTPEESSPKVKKTKTKKVKKIIKLLTPREPTPKEPTSREATPREPTPREPTPTVNKTKTKKIKKIIIIKEKTPEGKILKKTENKYANIIQKFIVKTKDKRRSVYLTEICSKSGFCIALGKEEKRLNEFFDGFINFKYAISPVKKIGALSVNGFVKEIIYEREKYKSYAILKSQMSIEADSLVYEYLVGMYINSIIQCFPNFVKTYGLLKYNNNKDFRNAYKSPLEINEFKQYLKPINNIDTRNPDLKALTCNKDSYLNCLLIEHVDTPINVFDIILLGRNGMTSFNPAHKIKYELPYVLYQIYFALSCLREHFTHYDLHLDNVLLYKPYNNSYITYHYHSTEGEFVFNSEYIAKIIDYGRCFYKYDETNNSNLIYEQLCNEKACGPKCGKKYGHTFFDKKANIYLMGKKENNMSYDLRYANSFKEHTNRWHANTKLNEGKALIDILDKIVFGVGIKKESNKRYGTKNFIGEAYNQNDPIQNVVHMKKALQFLITTLIPTDNYYQTNGYTKLGDLHIYEQKENGHFKPLNYIPAK